MKKQSNIVLWLVISGLMLGGCATGSKGHWWNPLTWGSASAAQTSDKAEAKVVAADVKVDSKSDAVVHAAHKEVFKTDLALKVLPASLSGSLAMRTNGNALGLLDQVDPLTGAEVVDLRTLMADWTSPDAAKVVKAEAAQSAAEVQVRLVSTELTQAQAERDKSAKDALAARAELRVAYDRENELANTLRNQRFVMYAAIGGVILLAALSVYLRMGLGSIGAGLHFLPKLVGQDNATKVIAALDSETDKFHQMMIAAGRAKMAAVEEQLKKMTGAV